MKPTPTDLNKGQKGPISPASSGFPASSDVVHSDAKMTSDQKVTGSSPVGRTTSLRGQNALRSLAPFLGNIPQDIPPNA